MDDARPRSTPSTEPKQAKVLDARERLIERRTAWLIGYLRSSTLLPAARVRPSRSAVIAHLVARAAPTLHQEGLALIADAGLLLFAVDDLLDEAELSHAEISLRVEQYAATASGGYCPECAFDPIALAITALRHRLKSQRGAPLVDEWAGCFERMLIAMQKEHRDSEAWRTRGALPSFADYLAVGRDSIGVEMIAWVAWIALGGAALSTRLASLREAAGHYSIAVRLANDVRSDDRERREGKLNAVVIAGPDGAHALRGAITGALEAGRALSLRAELADADAARFIDAFARGLVELYETRDFIEEVPRTSHLG